ncbi:RNA polymerase II C-terminal domain phosphatase-like 3 [Zingiber officinale]|uniref:RNA polymerase II C-terminal domain phosphatase-like 3 n=1 Tax=Zingiber officinale TaxID=94328 RepID=UPI001C4CF5F2|nr:RNA polymerase II C-terminal domain phosphatase-like 3 [Zingiber officinale]
MMLASDAKPPSVHGLDHGVLGGSHETRGIRRKRIDDESTGDDDAAKKQRVELPISTPKLALVLDLDLTLLNSIEFDRVASADKRLLRRKLTMQQEKDDCDLFCVDSLRCWTKLRPGIREFLHKARELFDLHVVTMGTQRYAAAMVELLDPTGTLFFGRIISREDASIDDHGLLIKNLDQVTAFESSVLILDDTVRVWPHNQWNLILIQRYAYFPYTCHKYMVAGDSPLYTGVDDDDALASVLSVLQRVHDDYHLVHHYASHVDVRSILASTLRS